ncbi:MAG: helix-turn-helix domain-containing protein [Bacteroidota bacterium]
MANFKSEISLASVAEKICMNPSSFSRYLKQTTNKTFTEFLNEIRISHACRLMVTNAKNISQIAYECGYNNISNFNRQFKIIKKQTPSEYMKIYKNINSV